MNTTAAVDRVPEVTPSQHGRTLLCGAVAEVLTELRGVIGPLSAEVFCADRGALFLHASIGAHVRHVLDHIAPIVDIDAGGCIDYDRRARGTPIEREPAAASAELLRVTALLSTAGALPGGEIAVLLMPRSNGEVLRIPSTIERELAFALSHTIHHCASVRGMLAAAGIGVPPLFGFAPSTLSYKAAKPCAR